MAKFFVGPMSGTPRAMPGSFSSISSVHPASSRLTKFSRTLRRISFWAAFVRAVISGACRYQPSWASRSGNAPMRRARAGGHRQSLSFADGGDDPDRAVWLDFVQVDDVGVDELAEVDELVGSWRPMFSR